MPDNPPPTEMTVQDFSQWARIGRTGIYKEINSGALRRLEFGRRTMIRRIDADAWGHAVQHPRANPASQEDRAQ